MSRRENAVTSDQFFADIMQGCDDASQFLRGEVELRVTHVEMIESSPAETTVTISASEVETRDYVTGRSVNSMEITPTDAKERKQRKAVTST